MMMNLKRDNPETFIVPTYDIGDQSIHPLLGISAERPLSADNIWHTHLAFPSLYLGFCRVHVGLEVAHDDTGERNGGSNHGQPPCCCRSCSACLLPFSL